jgi:glycosyltransferase involved in cell wall biosynthesis
MKIAIVTNQAFFVRGGAEYLAESLKYKLEQQGHNVEIIRIPFKWYPPENIVKHMMACRWIKLPVPFIDLVIALKFPAYYVPFTNKKLWLLHQFRQVYDLWGTPLQDIPNTPEGCQIRDMVVRADQTYFQEAKEIYTISHNVAQRLQHYNGIRATGVLYPPVVNPDLYWRDDPDNYFFYPSRLVSTKRQELAIEAMRYIKSDFRLVLAGKADTDAYGDMLQAKINDYGLQDRVKLVGYVSEEQKAALIARSVACLNLPYDEDYGYVTVEAFHARKPIIACKDGGAINEIVEHQVNGLIVDSSPEALAEAMETLWANRKRARDMGDQASATLKKLHIDWGYVLERLLS